MHSQAAPDLKASIAPRMKRRPAAVLLLLVPYFAVPRLEAFRSPPRVVNANGRRAVGSVFRATTASAGIERTAGGVYLDEKQIEFCKAYLNEHHKADVLLPLTRAFSELGTKSIKKNMWQGGSYSFVDAQVADITSEALLVDVAVEEGMTPKTERVAIPMDGDPVKGMARKYKTLPPIEPRKLARAADLPIDDFIRRMIRLCNIVKAYGATGKMIQMGVQLGGKGVGQLRDDLYLNQVPHSEYQFVFARLLNRGQSMDCGNVGQSTQEYVKCGIKQCS